MKCQKMIALLLACVLCLSLFAACGKQEDADDSTQNPVMNLIGTYMNDRCEMTIEAVGTDGAKISAYWGETAKDGYQWELTGTYDAETQRINYTDAVKTSVTYTDVDQFDVNEVVFENGKGYIQVNADNTLTWNDEQDADMAFENFEYVAAADDTEDNAAEDSQNPAMNFVGDYVDDRCTITVEADGDTDAKITVTWASSAEEVTEWTMSGLFDPDTFRVNYSDCVKKTTVYDENGHVVSENIDYENGYGRIQFNDDTLTWQDEQEPEHAQMQFVFVG